MSRNSAAKKARRKKRQTNRDARWIPAYGHDADQVEVDEQSSELLAAAEEFDTWILSRGWTYDEDNSVDGVATWFYEPSATGFDGSDFGGDESEPVTRVWISVVGDEDDFPLSVNAALVGTGDDGQGFYRISPAVLMDAIDEIEAYRHGMAVLALA